MFLFRDARGNEDAKMAGRFMDHVYDSLAPDFDLVLVGVSVDDLVERLLGRDDVVGEAREDDDRRSDGLEIQLASTLDSRFAARETIANEELLDDPTDFRCIHEMQAAPPALKFEERLPVAIDIRKQVVLLAEIVSPRVQHSEI
jgi:hypothetical protein